MLRIYNKDKKMIKYNQSLESKKILLKIYNKLLKSMKKNFKKFNKIKIKIN